MAAIQWMIDSVENEEADWVVETDRRGDAGRMVRFRPVDVASFVEPLLFHYGRSVRSEDDHAVTYLLDATFPAFLARYSHLLPAWFHAATIQQDRLTAAVREHP